MKSKQIIFVSVRSVVANKMAHRGACIGRPHKHIGGWESANSRIYLSTEMLVEWRRLRSSLDFVNDMLRTKEQQYYLTIVTVCVRIIAGAISKQFLLPAS